MKEKSGGQAVLWWVGWILLTIVSFFVSCYFWTGFIAKHVGPMDKPGVPIVWVSAVFGSWMVLLVPLIVVMYAKVDKAYEDARITRETRESQKNKQSRQIKSVFIERSERLLPKELTDKLKKYPEAIRHGHLVRAILKDGRKIDHVFILNKKEVLGVYGADRLSFNVGADIADLEPTDLDRLPNFKTEQWLRLDGDGFTR